MESLVSTSLITAFSFRYHCWSNTSTISSSLKLPPVYSEKKSRADCGKEGYVVQKPSLKLMTQYKEKGFKTHEGEQ